MTSDVSDSEAAGSGSFGFRHIQDLIDRTLARLDFTEINGSHGGPRLALSSVADPATEAGFLRLWQGPRGSLADRMVHFRIASGPVDTQLFFLFGRADSVLPHLHVQVVQFSPEACVFNADFMPRLDPVDYPEYFRQVFDPLNKPYWKAVNDYQNVCSHAPGNPAIAAYLSPWSIGCSRPATRAELERVTPSIQGFLDHWLDLATTLDFRGPDGAVLRARDARHLACFMDENLDPRAWKGVYRIIGEAAGQEVRRLIATPLS
jgi:hypothetical protein